MPNPTRVLSHRDDVRAAFGDDATVIAIDGPEGTDFVVCVGAQGTRIPGDRRGARCMYP